MARIRNQMTGTRRAGRRLSVLQSFRFNSESPLPVMSNPPTMSNSAMSASLMAVLVLQNIVECLKEMMLQGVPVKLDGLGTFSPGITGTPATSVEAYSVDNIVGVNMNFRPEGAGFEDEKLDKKTLKDSAVFELNDYVEVKYTDPDPVTGKRKSYQVRHPLKNYSIYKEDITPEP